MTYLRPVSEAELATFLQEAKGPLTVIGGGTRHLGPITGPVLSTAGLTGIKLYDPGALTLVAGAGTPLTEIEALLGVEGQRLAFEPPDFAKLLGRSGTSTIGGVAAANASGPRRVQAGACRDSMIGLRFATSDGAVLRNGGRVMKNVTGYDLVKLLAGSHGRLAVITELAFKLLPAPETQATLRLRSPQDPVAAMSKALGTPYEVSAAALAPDGCVYLRLEGFAASVAYRLDRLSARLAPLAEIERLADPAQSAAIWRDLRDMTALTDCDLVSRTSIKPSDFNALLAEITGQLGSMDHKICADWGGGLVWLGLSDACQNPDRVNRLMALLRAFSARQGGHTTLIKAPDALWSQVPVFQPEPAGIAALTQAIRQKFDPRGILSPARRG